MYFCNQNIITMSKILKNIIPVAIMGLTSTAAFSQQMEPADSIHAGNINNTDVNVSRQYVKGGTTPDKEHISADMKDTAPIGVMLPSMRQTGPIGTMLTYTIVPGESAPFNWKGGGLFGTGYTTDFPGLMRLDNAALGVYQNFGNFTAYAGGIANRYGNYWGEVQTQFGVEASLTYQIAPRLSANVFGIYYFSNQPQEAFGLPITPAMVGFYDRTNFGASIDYQINDRWGVEAGAQMVRHLGSNRLEAIPIASPYYKINNKVKISLPVGEMLYHILRK